jgi:hypothetical protein
MARMPCRTSPHLVMRGIPKLHPMYIDNTYVRKNERRRGYSFKKEKISRALLPDFGPIFAGSSTS